MLTAGRLNTHSVVSPNAALLSEASGGDGERAKPALECFSGFHNDCLAMSSGGAGTVFLKQIVWSRWPVCPSVESDLKVPDLLSHYRCEPKSLANLCSKGCSLS